MQACCEKRGALSAYCPYAATLVWVFLVVLLPPPPLKKVRKDVTAFMRICFDINSFFECLCGSLGNGCQYDFSELCRDSHFWLWC